jgi:Ser/Thr protein kinase RdoA (MazF antagonist)
VIEAALAQWGLTGAPATLAAQRENQVWRVTTPSGALALRLHRPGLRTPSELTSELALMAIAPGGPQPVPSRAGQMLELVGDTAVTVLTWIDGPTMGEPAAMTPASCQALGRAIARLHLAADAWTPPPGFTRPAWDADGLIGAAPLWGRFWDNPHLSQSDCALLIRARAKAAHRLSSVQKYPGGGRRPGAAPPSEAGPADYGLIHADAVADNVILRGGDAILIDYDDSGWGWRLFDLATTLNRLDREPVSGPLSDAFLQGYLATRPIDLSDLPLFRALRAFTYLGWIVPRIHEPGGAQRHARFAAEARTYALALLESP